MVEVGAVVRLAGFEVGFGVLDIGDKVGITAGSSFVSEAGVIWNQFKFQSPPVPFMPKELGPPSRLTLREIVTQFCQPPVAGKLTVSYTSVPPALSN